MVWIQTMGPKNMEVGQKKPETSFKLYWFVVLRGINHQENNKDYKAEIEHTEVGTLKGPELGECQIGG